MSIWIITTMSITLATPTMVTVVVFLVNFYQFGTLDVAAVFPTLILLGMLRSVLYNLPQYQARFVSARISMKRLESYLQQREIPSTTNYDTSIPTGSVRVTNGVFDWSGEVPYPFFYANYGSSNSFSFFFFLFSFFLFFLFSFLFFSFLFF